MGDLLFDIGIVLSIAAIAGFAIYSVVSYLSGKKLEKKLDEEYGKKPRRLGDRIEAEKE